MLRFPVDIALGGYPAPLLTHKLPRLGEVALAVEYHLFKKLDKEEAERKVTKDILQVYMDASIPMVDPKKVKQKVLWVRKLVRKRRKDTVLDKRFNRDRVMGKHCRLYMSEKKPSLSLARIVNFIVFVYAPVFLAIKHKSRVQERPRTTW